MINITVTRVPDCASELANQSLRWSDAPVYALVAFVKKEKEIILIPQNKIKIPFK